MIERGRENRVKNDVTNVEFRRSEFEHLPVADGSVDAVISNCVINLSADKPRVFAEAFRVLRPGGRLAITNAVVTTELPPDVRTDLDSISACVGGAATIDALHMMMGDVGFESISLGPKDDNDEFVRDWSDEVSLEKYLVSARIEARKPT